MPKYDDFNLDLQKTKDIDSITLPSPDAEAKGRIFPIRTIEPVSLCIC